MGRILKLLAILLCVLLLAGVALRLFVFDIASIKGDNMLPALGDGAMVIVNRRAEIRRGDLVVLRGKEGYIIRRVIGLPGETVGMSQTAPVVAGHPATQEERRRVTIAGVDFTVRRETLDGRSWEILDDDKRKSPDLKAKVVDGYYVLADHREHSVDSRGLGPIPRGEIRGVVWVALTRGDLF